MKIVFFTTCGKKWGGSELLWTSTAKKAIESGHHVAFSIFDWVEQSQEIAELIDLGAVPFFRRPFYPKLLIRLRKKILNIFLPKGYKVTYNDNLIQFHPDHIFFNLAGGQEIIQDTRDLFVFIKQIKVPFSVFYHSVPNNNDCDEFAKENFKFLVEKSSASYFTSKLQVLEYEKHFGCVILNKSILNHPLREIISKDFFHSTVSVTNLCMVGSLVMRWKGQDIALKALTRLFHERWHLNIYGEGEDELQLRELVNVLNLNDKVTFHGHVSNINHILLNNDLMLIPSQQDSGPIVFFEAMLAGLPVVGTKVGAMADYLVTGVNGVLALHNDCVSFANALQYAFENKIFWKDWGLNSRIYLQEHYDFQASESLLKRITDSISH